jgi:tetratricopeptide (TPR) repeat protein
MKVYSTREVSEVLGLPASTILSWTRAGLLRPLRGPRGTYLYSFQDIALLRSARELLEAEVPTRRVRRTLEALQEQLPVGRPLSAVALASVGDRILVRDAERMWDPASDQIVLDLEGRSGEAGPDDPSQEAPDPMVPARADGGGAAPIPSPEPATADAWYDAALDLEASDPREAGEAYRRAIALNPRHADALLNLGRLMHEAEDLAGAEARYRAALDADPTSARATYNLGVVMEDQGRADEALDAYERAVVLEPDLAAAHFNLSRLYEAAGRQDRALGHLAAYKRILDRDRSDA